MVGIKHLPGRYPDHSYTPFAWYLVCLMTKNACNDAGDEIIHAYMKLISDTNPSTKR